MCERSKLWSKKEQILSLDEHSKGEDGRKMMAKHFVQAWQIDLSNVA
jgi:hypothetical protein